MVATRWNATVVDAPGSEPCAVVGELVVAVRTPRSRDFVTVEVAPSARGGDEFARPTGVFLSPTPYPCLECSWNGEVRVGATVGFRVAGEHYRLTLTRLSECPSGTPWVTCDFSLERD